MGGSGCVNCLRYWHAYEIVWELEDEDGYGNKVGVYLVLEEGSHRWIR